MIFEFQKEDDRRRSHNKRSQNSSNWTSIDSLFESNDTFTEVQVKKFEKKFTKKYEIRIYLIFPWKTKVGMTIQ